MHVRLKRLILSGVPVTNFDPSGLSLRQSSLASSEPCPVFDPRQNYTADKFWELIPKDRISVREELVPRVRMPSSILVWLENVTRVVDTFDRTVMWCEQKKDLVRRERGEREREEREMLVHGPF